MKTFFFVGLWCWWEGYLSITFGALDSCVRIFIKNSLFVLITVVANWDDFVHISTNPTALIPLLKNLGWLHRDLASTLGCCKTIGPILEPIDTRYQRPVFRKVPLFNGPGK